ncbi:cytosine-specific methyltransferase [Croceivirga lutea]|uniref:DNA (cytosine-5-)-methyltransferase n=1 Tax=Croceivirga lutea TaxID=1775167 RepID=UPI00163A07DE|nr:DNA (cytosine-5-)-methyltransferase [Croceivirga lutea]GGG38705.1 cytosine-specific methyltransferase [Croceivirga lutea]
MPKLTVCELFAGVGGFRLGLERSKDFKVIWSNQWEPSTKTQHASMVYENRFGNKNHSNLNIEEIATSSIPNHDVLVGGFPCQDYSVATSLKNSKGLVGKKGVLWWSIYRILKEKESKPSYLILENVDRLLKSPVKQRGRDFAIMLKGLSDLGYACEWRVINAAEYGYSQRRRRFFLVGIHHKSNLYKQLLKSNAEEWVLSNGVLASAFPVTSTNQKNQISLSESMLQLSKTFNSDGKISPFLNSGLLLNGNVISYKTLVNYNGPFQNLKSVLEKDKVADEFYINIEDLPKWKYLKGAKKESRTTKEGFKYKYSEGSMAFPDDISKPSRTIITGEGGKSASRFKHVIETAHGLRRLTPLELERLNGFPDNHTKLEGITNTKRAFFMGNALVVDIVEKIGQSLLSKI